MVQTAPGNPRSFGSWSALLQALKALEPQVVPAEAARISAQDRAAIAAVDAARKAQKKSLYLTVGSMVSLLLLVAAAVWFFLFRGREREHDELVHIPAGNFLFQSGEEQTLPDFWIDKHEVTIGQYAKFLKDLEDHPRGQYPELYERIEHTNQPPLKRVDGGHKPPNWHIFYPRAKGKMEVAGTPTSLDSPVVEVDWWDAWAYAKWRGRELPTEKEWEKAARGTKGFAYPWGEEADPRRVNSGADYHGGNPRVKAEVDGFIRYGDVDKQEKDKSPFGIVGMAGNVSEWVADEVLGPDKRTKYPLIKGGNFTSADVKLDRRINDRRPDATHDWLGFRTVSHSPPKK
jgi:formylglycine-generating enzyme required for sulfatase activity